MKKHEFNEKEIKEIIYDYVVLKLSRKRIGDKYRVCDDVVKRVLKENNVKIRGIQETNTTSYNINHHFFDIKKQTPEMAYVLGLIASDGCISSVDNQVYIELQREDKEILLRINKIIENEREVKDYTTSRNYNNSKIYFYSKTIKDDLKKYHIVPNKTYNDEYSFPEILKKELFPYYLLGLFDGDGSIKKSRDWAAWQIDTSSLDVAEKIKERLLEYGIDIHINQERKTNIIIYRCITYKKDNLIKLYNLLYSNIPGQLFLKRKYSRYKEILNEITSHETDHPLTEDEKLC